MTAAKKEWEATVDAIEDPLFVTDFDYTILRANLATFQTLGKGVKDVVGKKCYVFKASNEPAPKTALSVLKRQLSDYAAGVAGP